MNFEIIKFFTDCISKIKDKKELRNILDNLDIAYCESKDHEKYRYEYEIYSMIIWKYLEADYAETKKY